MFFFVKFNLIEFCVPLKWCKIDMLVLLQHFLIISVIAIIIFMIIIVHVFLLSLRSETP